MGTFNRLEERRIFHTINRRSKTKSTMPRFQQVTSQQRRGAGLGITSPGVSYDNYSNNATQVFSVNDASNGNECNTGDEKMANKVVNNSQVNSSSPSHEPNFFPNYRKRRKEKKTQLSER